MQDASHKTNMVREFRARLLAEHLRQRYGDTRAGTEDLARVGELLQEEPQAEGVTDIQCALVRAAWTGQPHVALSLDEIVRRAAQANCKIRNRESARRELRKLEGLRIACRGGGKKGRWSLRDPAKVGL